LGTPQNIERKVQTFFGFEKLGDEKKCDAVGNLLGNTMRIAGT
jgi:hypothetical protein